MSALSFVALSLQTTHLDPATVSKASYVKLVGGNITRLDTIQIHPPTASDGDNRSIHPAAMAWPDALTNLSMMIGKLPIISYYRDADKEVFHAASRHVGHPPPAFSWLDCRALARTLLPELPEFQLSTVLKALDLYDDYADRSMVEQTAQIVLTLAAQQQASTLKELWGDLYDQPDDLLDLEMIFDGAAPSPLHSAETEHLNAASLGLASTTGPSPVALDTGEDAASTPQTAEEGLGPDDVGQEDQPAFLKIPDRSETHDENLAWDEPDQAPSPEEPGHPEPLAHPTSDDDAHTLTDVSPTSEEVSSVDIPETASIVVQDDAPASNLPDADEPDSATASDGTATQTPLPAKLQPAEFHRPAADDEAPDTKPEPAQHDDAFDTSGVLIPAPVSASEKTQDAAGQRRQPPVAPVLVPPREGPIAPLRRRRAQRQARSPVARFFGLLGLVCFGVLSLLGIAVTVMAILLFFTPNDLMVEIKIAGVILTGAVTMLSMLMAVMSYRSLRRRRG